MKIDKVPGKLKTEPLHSFDLNKAIAFNAKVCAFTQTDREEGKNSKALQSWQKIFRF